MNWMERSAMQALTENDSLRLKQLLPKDVPNNLYSYHLQKLLAAGLVERQSGQYRLTLKGKQLAGQIDVDTGRVRQQPKIVAMFYIENDIGEVLLFRWKRQPYYDYVSFPYGKIDFGKTLEQNVKNEFFKKTSLDIPLTHSSDFYMTIYSQEQIVSHMLVHLFVGKSNTQPKSNVRTGSAFWGKLDTQGLTYFPGLTDIQKLKFGKFNKLADLEYHLS